MRILITIIVLLFSTGQCYAAFPIHPKTNTQETVVHQTDVEYKVFVNDAIERFTQKPAPPPASESDEGSGLGIASLVLAIAGILALIGSIAVGLLTGLSAALIAFSALAGLAAIILGAIGLRRSRKGFSIAGLVLGIIDLCIVPVVAFFLLLLTILSGD